MTKKILATVLATLCGAGASQAAESPATPAPTPPVCTSMPDRQGHFWDEKDWCQWLRDFDNNRERRDREKANPGR